MAHATAAELKEHLGDRMFLLVADRDGDGQGDDTAVEQALEDASSVVDSYMPADFLPLVAPVPRAIRRATCDIAAFDLAGVDRENELLYRRQKEALRWLELIANGKVKPFPSDPGVELKSSDGPQYVETCRVFSRESMRGVI